MANMAQRVCSKLIDPRPLEAFLANRLLPFDKCPSVHPIGIGEAPRRIISKTIIKSLKSYIQPAAGSMQLCAGQSSGCEAIIHSMQKIFQSDASDALLLVDADNAFNRLN
jgi:hypothetical protein